MQTLTQDGAFRDFMCWAGLSPFTTQLACCDVSYFSAAYFSVLPVPDTAIEMARIWDLESGFCPDVICDAEKAPSIRPREKDGP